MPSAFREGGRGQGGEEHASERTRRCVSERADEPTPASAEPGRRKWRRGRDSNPRCFRTPLFESGTINHSDTSPRERIPNRRRPTPWPGGTGRAQATGDASKSSSASSRRMPLTTLMRRGERLVLGELDDRARPPRRGRSGARRRAPRRRSRGAPRRTSRRARGSRRSWRRRGSGVPSLRAASRRATTTAWAVGSFVSWTRSWARATIASSTTATAAIGPLAAARAPAAPRRAPRP